MYDDTIFLNARRGQGKYDLGSYASCCSLLAAQDVGNDEYATLHEVCMWGMASPCVKEKYSWGENDINQLVGIHDKITDDKLKALVCDVIWASRRAGKNAYAYAKIALLSYARVDIDEQRWFLEHQNNCWQRALCVAQSLGKSASTEREILFERLKTAYQSATQSQDRTNLLIWAIPQLLYECKLYDLVNPADIAKNFCRLAEMHKQAGDNSSEALALNNAIKWFSIANKRTEIARLSVARAESFKREADREANKKDVSWLRAGDLYRLALNEYLKLPNNMKDEFGIDSRIDMLKRQIDEVYAKVPSQMERVSVPTIDISDDRAVAVAAVRGVSFERAIKRLCLMFPLTEAVAESCAKERLKHSFLVSLFTKSFIGGGAKPRIVAQVPGCSGAADSRESKERLDAEKILTASWLINFYCQARLYPAYLTIKQENDCIEHEFSKIVDEAPLIPANHKLIFARALQLGFGGDFTPAAYMLAPEIENLIRERLNLAGVVTTYMQNGVQQEKGLSNLAEEGRLVDLFGSDFVFELKTVFCSHIGYNLRNEIAHGLKDDASYNSIIDFYVWYFALKICFMRSCARDEIGA